MAVTKKEKKPPKLVGTGTDKDIERAISDIKMKFGDDAIMKLGDTPKVDVNAIPTGSIGVDWALGIGGLPRGRVIEVFGPESSGKTSLCLHVIAEAQKKGVPVITPSNNQKNGGGHTCNLTAPKISCHYGGTKCNGEGNAVDFALRADVPKTPANWSKLQSAASSCGAQGAGSSYCEISYAPYRTELGCSDPGINHLHVNTSKSCGCD